MVLVDTNIWISLYRGRETSVGEMVSFLVSKNEAAICGQVFVEFIGGFRQREKRKEFGESFKQFPFLEATEKIFHLAAELLGEYPRLGAGDAVIAATALSYELPLLTFDKDFSILKAAGLRLVKV